MVDPDAAERWTASGCRDLTGQPDAPGLDPPPGLLAHAESLASRFVAAADEVSGRTVSIDPLAELALRRRTRGLSRQGRTSCGGATRLLRGADGWLALTLARADDVALVAALTDGEVTGATRGMDGDGQAADSGAAADTTWRSLEAWCAARPVGEVRERAILLGLPVARLGERDDEPRAAVEVERLGTAPPWRAGRAWRVVDLSALWAGPLCGHLLHRAGAEVVRVASATRPDGARQGDPELYGRLAGGAEHRTVDLTGPEGRAQLAALVAGADVVIEAARPRALAGLGVDVHATIAAGPRAWVSITGHGYHGAGSDRVAFGDDAAVAGGLVAGDPAEPVFCADAIADPLTGITAAVAVLETLTAGTRSHLDVAMSAVAAAAVRGRATLR